MAKPLTITWEKEKSGSIVKTDRKLIEAIQVSLKNKNFNEAFVNAHNLSPAMLKAVSQTIALQAVVEGDLMNYYSAMEMAEKNSLIKDLKMIFLTAVLNKNMLVADDLFRTIGDRLNLLELSMFLNLVLESGIYDYAKAVAKRMRRPLTVAELEMVLANGLGTVFVRFGYAVEIAKKIGRKLTHTELKILLADIVHNEAWDDFYELEDLMPEKYIKAELKRLLPEYVLRGELQICKFIVEKLDRNLTKDELIKIIAVCKEKDHQFDLVEAESMLEEIHEN